MKRFLNPREFATAAAKAENIADVTIRAADGAIATDADAGDRSITFVLSTSAVARDGHTIASDGWVLDNYLRNPVFLWAHRDDEAPIGRMARIWRQGDQLRGTVEYADAESYPFADTIFRLTKGGFINAVSVSWLPIDWKFATGADRAGGIDFLRQELLEVSAVPVPSLPTALATARAAGVDTAPLYDWCGRVLDRGGLAMVPRSELETLRREAKMAGQRAKKTSDWKVGASRDLPTSDNEGWDGPGAAKRMLAAAGFDGDKPNGEEARKGFLLYDAANPDAKGSYKEPFADIIDGKLTVTKGGIKAAASRLPQTDVPKATQTEARAVIDHYEEKLGMADEDKDRAVRPIGKRGLYEVAFLATMLMNLGYVHDIVSSEAAAEGDGSSVPAELAAAINQLGAVMVKMTAEEVGELLASLAGETDPEIEDVDDMTDDDVARAVLRNFARLGPKGRRAMARAGIAARIARAALTRAGKMLSADTVRCLRDACAAHERGIESHQSGLDLVRGLLRKADDDPDPDDDPDDDGTADLDDDEKRAQRILEARRLRRAQVET